MPRLVSGLLAAMQLALCCAACGGAGVLAGRTADKPHVLEWKPGDELTRLDTSIVLKFGRNMVGVDAVGPTLQAAPLQLQPEHAAKQCVPRKGALSGAQVVSIARSADEVPAGTVWVQANAEVSASIRRRDVSMSARKPAFSRGLSLERRYREVTTGKPLDRLALGELVQVELELRTQRALRMVALTDPMPAGLEPLDPGFVEWPAR